MATIHKGFQISACASDSILRWHREMDSGNQLYEQDGNGLGIREIRAKIRV